MYERRATAAPYSSFRINLQSASWSGFSSSTE